MTRPTADERWTNFPQPGPDPRWRDVASLLRYEARRLADRLGGVLINAMSRRGGDGSNGGRS